MSDGELRDLYMELILDHAKKPHNFRVPANANREALGHNPLCGDRLTLYLTLDENDKILDAAFQGSGCAISTASASMMTDMLIGKSRAEAETLFGYVHATCTGCVTSEAGLQDDDVIRVQALSGVRDYPMRVKCATLPWHTLQAALKQASSAPAKASTE